MNRRSFFAFLPIAPLALVAEGARAVTADGAPLSESVNLTLLGAKKHDGEMMRLSSGSPYILANMPQTDPTKAISMAVGDDGDLWLKRRNGEWKKVVTE